MGRHDRGDEKSRNPLGLATDLLHLIIGGLILAVITAPASIKVAMACIAVMVAVACWRAFV